ncbi:uroporphyrinogen decarboxylase family protein [Crateriforma conspicua]|uniref:uroporphyrinogen decarboxylase family protein n=1 Tax=Crateriforma conspicua TaxID=2527996 RepID=UPI00118C5864|nr:uroporphyrinogen decarboxylase family protein [Crateriforma conspicua]QDV62084.1 Uroporphyrinogen decarboxylase [Crateriforma conspicua]
MELTSRQRIQNSIRGQATDCVAVGPYMYDVAVAFSGVVLRDFYTDADVMTKAQLALHEALDQDVIAVGADNCYIAEGFGCKTTRERDELPAITESPAKALDEVFKIEPLDPYRDGRMPVMIDAIKQVRAAVGDSVAIRSPGTGPFALASYLIGSQTWLYEVGMLEAGLTEGTEDAIRHALEVAAESLIRFGKACWDAGADIIHCGDSLASCDMISPSTYERFALPYEQKVFQAWRDHGITGSLLHICGDSTRVLDMYAKSGAAIVEVDNMVDLSVAKQILGDRVALMGNVHTINDLLQGTPESVEEASRRCIENVGGGNHFILGSGCIVPRDTPIENLQAMVRIARSIHPTAGETTPA